VARLGGLDALLNLAKDFNEFTRITLKRNVIWAISNLCRGKPAPDFQKIKACIPFLNQALNYNDEDAATDACWALSYLSDGPNDQIQSIIKANVVPRVVQLMRSTSTKVVTPALRTIGI
jgi:hypothetical protein